MAGRSSLSVHVCSTSSGEVASFSASESQLACDALGPMRHDRTDFVRRLSGPGPKGPCSVCFHLLGLHPRNNETQARLLPEWCETTRRKGPSRPGTLPLQRRPRGHPGPWAQRLGTQLTPRDTEPPDDEVQLGVLWAGCANKSILLSEGPSSGGRGVVKQWCINKWHAGCKQNLLLLFKFHVFSIFFYIPYEYISE